MATRRDFFKRTMQLTLLTGLVGGAGYLVARNGITSDCTENGMCGKCSKLKDCKEKKAENFKEEKKIKEMEVNGNNRS